MGISDGDGEADEMFLSAVIEKNALTAMIQNAKTLNVEIGVAAVLVENPSKPGEIRYLAVNNTFYGDKVNYFGSVMSMIASMKALRRPSGVDEKGYLKWESRTKGGLVRSAKSFLVYVAFDGKCSEEKNLLIANVGMQMLVSDEPKG